MNNPFTPNFGQVPMYLAGRQDVISEMTNVFKGDLNSPNLCSLFTGARGTGKTALLSLLAQEASSMGWISVSSTGVKGFLEDLYEQVVRNTSQLLEPKSKTRIKSVSVGQLVGIELEKEGDTNLNWRSRMTNVLEVLKERGVGLLIAVDEVDPCLEETVKLVTTYQQFIGEGFAVSLLMAGLPHRVSSLLNGKSISFLRRANIVKLGRIEDFEVRDALVNTVEDTGGKIENGALDLAVNAIEGFPFMMQLVGYYSWNATAAGLIDESAVTEGIDKARAAFRTRVLDATLNDLTDREIEFLKAMTSDESFSKTVDLAKRLSMSSGNVSTYKKRLLEQGVIEEPRRGIVRFALPHLREYLPEYAEFL